MDTISRSDTYPYVDIREDDVSMGHEATVSKISDDQLFYLMSRGLTEDEAMAMIVRGFIEPIAKELPMEYALELNRLIELQMEGRGRLTLAETLTRATPETPEPAQDQGAGAALVRRRRLPGPDRPGGGVAVHAAQAAARAGRRRAAGRRPALRYERGELPAGVTVSHDRP